MRITGLASGLDVDSIITETMSAYRTKIDQQTQKKDILEIKQKLYKDMMSESKTFYNKYFDILSSDSILNSSSWKSVSYTTTKDSSVKVTATSSAVADNYKITGTIATAAKKSIKEEELGKAIVINGKSFTIDETLSNKDKATKLTADLKESGINVSVKYSDFAGTTGGNVQGFIFESTKLGADNSFTIGGISTKVESVNDSFRNGENAKANSIKLMSSDELKGITEFKYNIKIGEDIINLNIPDLGKENDVNERLKIINNKLSEIASADGINTSFKDLYAVIENDEVVIKTQTLGNKAVDFSMEINGKYEIADDKEDATKTFASYSNDDILTGKFTINNVLIDMDAFDKKNENSESYQGLSNEEKNKEKIKYINEKLSLQGVGFTASVDGENVNFEANVAGEKSLEINKLDSNSSVVSGGNDAKIVIENSKGGIYTHTGTSNSVLLDGVNFTFTSIIPEGGIEVNGKTNVDDVKDKIVKLFNDYNNLMEKLNTLTTTKRNRDYAPLTDEQRSELSESELELWDSKVEAGQLYRDSDLTRISNSLKEAMRTMVSGTGLTLEQIGISPVSDYGGTKNGTFTIDENKLTSALETNMDNIKNMFVQSKPTDSNLSSSQKYSQTGIFNRVKDILYSETMISTSSLAKKAGITGTATATNNTLYNSIKDYEKKIGDMEDSFTSKQQALYSKYATLETLMNNLNSQQSYLYQSLGISTS